MSRLASSCAFSSAVYLLPACIVYRGALWPRMPSTASGMVQSKLHESTCYRASLPRGCSVNRAARSYPVGDVHFVSYHDLCPSTNTNICTHRRKCQGFPALLSHELKKKKERLILYPTGIKFIDTGQCFNFTSVVWRRAVQTATIMTNISPLLLN